MDTWADDARQNHRIDTPVLPLSPLQHAETARLAQYEPDVPATLLPLDINRRANAALSVFGHARNGGGSANDAVRIAANARYIERELRQLRLGQCAAGDPLNAERLRAAFTGGLPAIVKDRIWRLRRDRVSGTALRDALAELEARLAPAPPPTPPTWQHQPAAE